MAELDEPRLRLAPSWTPALEGFLPRSARPDRWARSAPAPSGLPPFQDHDPSAPARRAADELTGGAFSRLGWGPGRNLPFACVHDAIEAWCRECPEQPALEHLGEVWTYGRLDRQAEEVARSLEVLGVSKGDRVGVFLQRGIPMVVGILAVLKLGAAYVPQDARVVPAPMLRQVMENAGIRVVLSSAAFIPGLPLREGETALDMDALCAQAPPARPEGLRRGRPGGDDICFVLYTSGTTGRPNGVMVRHRNVCNILHTPPGHLHIRPGMRVGQVLAISFDMAAWEILGCLSHGGTLVIRGADIAETAATLDVLIATPSILARLEPEACPRMRTVALAGEPCPRPLAERWAAHCALYIGCGPTEVTIVNTLSRYRPGDPLVSIGVPVPNTSLYVLDDRLQPCAIGEPGEMWAGGACVSAGYLGDPGLTAERYKPDPFRGGNHRMFRTRDLGRWLEDGRLEHLGRVDDQVKVRGFRVELDSVSAVLERGAGCLRAVTLKASDRELVAFVTPAEADVEDARAQVRQALPYYCEPALILALESLPMTDRGKVDKALLLERARPLLARVLEPAGGEP